MTNSSQWAEGISRTFAEFMARPAFPEFLGRPAFKEESPSTVSAVPTAAADPMPHSLRLPTGYVVENTAVGGWTWIAPDGFCRGGYPTKVETTDAAWRDHESGRKPMSEAGTESKP